MHLPRRCTLSLAAELSFRLLNLRNNSKRLLFATVPSVFCARLSYAPDFLSSIPPFVVASFNSRPPPPTVPETFLVPKVPCTVIGKSVWIFPLVVAACSWNAAGAGSDTVIPPFVVASSSSPFQSALPIAIATCPFVERPEPHSLVSRSTFPLVVLASTTLFKSRPRMLPFVVSIFRFTPCGVFTEKVIFARELCQKFPDSESTPPRWHRPGAAFRAYTAQIVTPSEYSTTSINGSCSSPCPLRVASTCADSSDAPLASISPLRPMTSNVCPAASFACQ